MSAASLGPAESALLAGAIINPRRFNPARPNARLLRRQQLILRRMRAAPGAPAIESGDRVPPREMTRTIDLSSLTL
jgi:hypothetical protein